MNNIEQQLKEIAEGFKSLHVEEKYKVAAEKFIEDWLSGPMYKDYVPQITNFIQNKDWDFLLDCFYQIIPFGTGGRRGEVGIGPNRINKWTIQASAQGHSQYLKKIHGEEVATRGVVLAYGVREFFADSHFDSSIPNPVQNLKGLDLAVAAAEVYAANGVKVMIFDAPRTTPELSFSIRHLQALAGDMFDASHNPPEHNGKKVYEETGGQLIPPDDQTLVEEVTRNVKEINTISFDEGLKKGIIQYISKDVDEVYVSEIAKLSMSEDRNIKIVYTPLHGVGSTSILKALERVGFEVLSDPKTSFQSGKFENVTFHIPNPEVVESFDTTLKYAREMNADIILNSDPDADRIGVMVKNKDEWVYLNGNEIAAVLAEYVIQKRKNHPGKKVIIKTSVTTNLVTKICEANGVEINGELLVGFKYIGFEMNKLEKAGRIRDFLLGTEESNGYIAGNYVRDKDSSVAGIWLAELGAELKKEGKTIIDYLTEIYSKYGYFKNFLTEIRLPGAEGMEQIQKIQTTLRTDNVKLFEKFIVEKVEDLRNRTPIVSETDNVSKDVLIYHIKPFEDYITIKVSIRPSGTEPKSKMYFEIGTAPFPIEKYDEIRTKAEMLMRDFEKSVLQYCYKAIGIDFPERGFLIFWQVPMKDKLHYFDIEPEIEKLKDYPDKKDAEKKLGGLLEFLGADGVEKVDAAFKAKNKMGIREYLSISK